jgi:hypothetical protein
MFQTILVSKPTSDIGPCSVRCDPELKVVRPEAANAGMIAFLPSSATCLQVSLQ